MEGGAGAGHRERLIEAAIVCLGEKGYARTTARDLVARSGTNLASIGYHFGSKEHLLNVAIGEASRRWLKPLIQQAAEPAGATPLERLQHALSGLFDSVEENQALVTASLEAWAQLARSDDLRAEMLDTYDEFHTVITTVTRDAFAEFGVGEEVDSDALASLIIAVFDGMMVRWQLNPDRVPSAERISSAVYGAVVGLTLASSSSATTPGGAPGGTP